jgi:hypothetical protein
VYVDAEVAPRVREKVRVLVVTTGQLPKRNILAARSVEAVVYPPPFTELLQVFPPLSVKVTLLLGRDIPVAWSIV